MLGHDREDVDSSRTFTEEGSSYEQKTPGAPPTSNADKVQEDVDQEMQETPELETPGQA